MLFVFLMLSKKNFPVIYRDQTQINMFPISYKSDVK